MIEQALQYLKVAAEVGGGVTETLLSQWITYVMVAGALHAGVVFVVTTLVLKKLGALRNSIDPKSDSGVVWQHIFSTLQVGVVINALIYSYSEALPVLKILTAPYLVLAELGLKFLGK